MSLLEQLTQTLGGEALSQIGQQVGLDEGQASSVISSALPVLMGALARNSQKEGGAEALAGALDRDHDGGILDNLGGFLSQGDTSPGDAILKHVLGGNRQTVEQGLGAANNVDAGQAGKILSTLAPIILGQLGKAKRSQGLDASGLAGMLAGERQKVETKGGGALDMIGNLLDRDGDGSAIDDVMGMIGGFLGKK